jgi:large subunit ribosomal protein L23
MQIFGSKKNTKAGKEDATTEKPAKKITNSKPIKKEAGALPNKDVAHILRRPRITEKASMLSEVSVFVFDVDVRASKRDVMDAIRFYYKAEPIKVNMIKIPSKNVFIRGKRGVKSGGKKAYVYLKKGESIEVI